MIQFILAKMPPPDRAAERFPHYLRNTFTSANLYEMAEWLREFADHFTEKGKDDVAA